MRLKKIIYFVVLFLFLSAPSFAQENQGTLIVTYQCGPKAERLHRVRFWLRGNHQVAQLYPKGNAFVDDKSNMSRMVVIENLPPGKYTVEFVPPNSDGLFEQTPKREAIVLPGKVVKIDQMIKPRYASLKVKTSFESDTASSNIIPKCTLQDPQGHVIAQSSDGKFVANHLVPGKYILVFEELSGFIAPPAMELTLGPNQNFGPIEGVYINESVDSAKTPINISYQETPADVIQKTVLVPEGKAIVGDPFPDNRENELSPKVVKVSAFYIGIYEVTNFQYAQWLTKALKEGKILYHTEKERQGQVTDKEGRLLFKTQKADPYSQIFTETLHGKTVFFPQMGKHKNPVIDVTWYGATAYCHDNQ